MNADSSEAHHRHPPRASRGRGSVADPARRGHHVVAGRIKSAQITHDSEQMTVEGGVLTIAINGGVIHVIDRVLIPAA